MENESSKNLLKGQEIFPIDIPKIVEIPTELNPNSSVDHSNPGFPEVIEFVSKTDVQNTDSSSKNDITDSEEPDITKLPYNEHSNECDHKVDDETFSVENQTYCDV
ncbi:MAG TPA: hypothetical protein PLD36_00095 [Bacteroidia bacterium]|jgi:hypothetical protein|nr:hypothetical protein [Bacteroidia bacterium]